MKKFIDFIGGFFSENGTPSSKRLVGIVCAGFLCWTMYANSFSESHFQPSESLVYAVASLAFGCLGLTSAEKIFKKTDNESK
jgi:hypothetical protein